MVVGRYRYNKWSYRKFYTKPNGCTILLYGGFTYGRHLSLSKNVQRYTCSKKKALNCKAYVHTTNEGIILKQSYNHCHDLPNYVIRDFIFTKSTRGNPLIQIGNYRFGSACDLTNSIVKRWICIKRNIGCTAKIKTIGDDIVEYNNIVYETSRTGRPVIRTYGYRYNMWSGSKGKLRVRWICVKVHSGCRATIITFQDEIIKCTPHNH
ncbi:unnamed protein product [Pieris macdunnoughi]|uniref:FLYWCH-type domain-containing protein n=1 Tax=Pieris macdunnoughi TaxID=345717 RepID=A0A821QEK9_9NEOP|nr:unnamed protein product [Pieris macdunnoughi]